MEPGALDVSMAVRPDLRPHAFPADEGVVARHRAVRINPDDLAEAGRQVLRLVTVVEAFAQRDEQSAVAGEDEARPEVVRALHLRLLLIDHLDVIEAALA